jgi:Tol biopolymer transport system component
LIVIILGVTAILQKHNSSAPLYRAVPLTTYPGFEFDVALSYDGNQVAFTGTIDSTLQMDLFVKQIEVETPQQLTSDPAIEISPGWSPDGRALAYIKGEVDTSCGLMLMRLPGGDERKLADCHTLLVTGVSWSPDGRTIAYSDRLGHDKPFRIYLLDVQTRAITPLTDPEDGLFGDFSATFSPDGRSVGFIRGTVANTTALNLAPAVGDMYSISLDTKTETRHTFENQEIAHIDWTPDGKHLVFASRWERGIPGLWKVNIQTGMLTWLMGIDGYIRKPMMARRSNRLVFEKWDNEVSIWKAELDTLDHGPLNAKPLIRSTHFDAAPQFSPDGRHLAFISQRSGASEIWISDADGEQSLQLTGIGGPVTSNPRWSPDGRHLTFESRKDGQADIYRINVNGTPVRRLTHHPAQDMIPSWSPDGVWIYFGSNRNGTWQIWKMPGEGGAATQVTTDGGFLALAPPVIDHPYLYYTRLNRSGLFRISLQDGTENRIIPDFSFAEWGNWMPAETGIFFAERLPDRRWSKLLYYDYATELIEEVGRIRGLGIGMIGLTLTPDRRTLAYVRQYNNNSDLWMIDHFE